MEGKEKEKGGASWLSPDNKSLLGPWAELNVRLKFCVNQTVDHL